MVKDELAERGWTRKELAKRIGVSGAAITVVLRPSTRSSRLVDAISAALEIPTPDFQDERDAQMVSLMRELRMVDHEGFDWVLARAERFVRKAAGKAS